MFYSKIFFITKILVIYRGKMAKFAAKKYKSYRRIPDSIYNEFNLYINK